MSDEVRVIVLFVPDRDSNGRAMRSGKWLAQPVIGSMPVVGIAPMYFDDRATAVDWADRCRVVVRPIKADEKG